MFNKFCVVLIFLLFIGFSVALLGNESTSKYFPSTLDSYRVYEDQDGNEFTRRAIEGEEIAGKTFPAFSYEPELKDWVDYSCFIRPSLYQVSDTAIKLVVGDEVEKAVKARLKKEIDFFIEIMKSDLPASVQASFEMKVDYEAEAKDNFNLLHLPISVNEEWDVTQIDAKIKMKYLGVDAPEDNEFTIDFTILETGIVVGTETVETPAGTFDDCLKVEYQTETTAVLNPPEAFDPPGETLTTLWFSPDIGIVKLHQKSGNIFLDMIPDFADIPIVIPPIKEKILELKRYEIKTEETKTNESN